MNSQQNGAPDSNAHVEQKGRHDVVVNGSFAKSRVLGLDDEEFIAHTVQFSYFMNAVAGHHPNAGWEALDKQIDIISSEFNSEMLPALANRDLVGVRDGLADTLFTLLGFAYRAGINAIDDLKAVCTSNCTKFDNEPEDAALTVEKYKALGVEVYQRTVCTTGGRVLQQQLPGEIESVKSYQEPDIISIVTYSAKDQVGTDGKLYRADTWLKSHNYQEPIFMPLDPGNKLLKTEVV